MKLEVFIYSDEIEVSLLVRNHRLLLSHSTNKCMLSLKKTKWWKKLQTCSMWLKKSLNNPEYLIQFFMTTRLILPSYTAKNHISQFTGAAANDQTKVYHCKIWALSTKWAKAHGQSKWKELNGTDFRPNHKIPARNKWTENNVPSPKRKQEKRQTCTTLY